MQKRFLLGAAFCGLFFGGAPALPADDALTSGLNKILDAPALRGGITGAIVQRVSDGKILYTDNPDTRLLPASNRKLFTSAAALELLGDNFTYTTKLLATAKPDAGGVLHGDLVLKGVGDSSLKTADLDDLAAQVAKAGIKCITGNIYGDGSVFTDGPYGFGWEWDDLSDSEFPQIAGLEVNDGDVAVTATSGGTPGQPVEVTETPIFGGATIENTARTESKGNSGDLQIRRAYDQSAISVSGALPVGATSMSDVPIVDPPAYAAAVLREGLIADGIIIQPPPSGALPHINGVLPTATIELASHTSPPLSEYIALMNKPSDNLLAESLVRTLGIVKGSGGTYDAGHAVETPFFKSLGVPVDDIALVDGCGVGRRNFVTARSVGQLLVTMHGKADWKTYYDSLPIAGTDGTLQTRMVGTPAQGNVHAKTGTLSQVRCLSGYFTGSHGTLYAFSLLMNNFPGTAREAGAVQDRFVLFLLQSL